MKQNKPKWELYDLDNIEHNLFEDYIVEFNDISGIKILYYIAKFDDATKDNLYGETTDISYEEPIETKLIYEPTEEPDVFKTFGIVSDELIQFALMPKRTFYRDICLSRNIVEEIFPKPGDVVKTIWNDRSYEVIDVSQEQHIFQLKKFVYGFVLRPYRFSDESTSSRTILKEPDRYEDDPLSMYGDNDWIDEKSNEIDDYEDVDEGIYGF